MSVRRADVQESRRAGCALWACAVFREQIRFFRAGAHGVRVDLDIPARDAAAAQCVRHLWVAKAPSCIVRANQRDVMGVVQLRDMLDGVLRSWLGACPRLRRPHG